MWFQKLSKIPGSHIWPGYLKNVLLGLVPQSSLPKRPSPDVDEVPDIQSPNWSGPPANDVPVPFGGQKQIATFAARVFGWPKLLQLNLWCSQLYLRNLKGESCQNQMALELDESNILKQTIVSSRVTSHQCITWSVGISVATHSESLDGFCLSHTIILHTKCSILQAVTSCTFVLGGSAQDLKVRITPIYNPILGGNNDHHGY